MMRTATAVLLALSASLARADEVVFEPFDGDQLDPAWGVTFEDANGWTYQVGEGRLTVTDIDPAIVNSEGGVTWAVVTLGRDVPTLLDFDLLCGVAWDSDDNVRAIQQVGVALFDRCGNWVAYALMADNWGSYTGATVAGIPPAEANSGRNSLPFHGTAEIGISRAGGQLTVTWNGSELILPRPLNIGRFTLRRSGRVRLGSSF